MNACELCVFGTGLHREDCTYLAKWRKLLKPLEELASMRRSVENTPLQELFARGEMRLKDLPLRKPGRFTR